jgi:hypothetical protein
MLFQICNQHTLGSEDEDMDKVDEEALGLC